MQSRWKGRPVCLAGWLKANLCEKIQVKMIVKEEII